MQRLHPATIVVNLFEFVRQFVFAIIVVALSSAGRDDATFEIMMAALGGLGVLSSVYRYMITRYGIQSGALVVHKGGLWKQERTISLDRIQNVTIKRSIIERLIGVCSVVVETAAGLQTEAQLSSLSQEDAESLRSRLLSVVSTEKGPSFELPPALYMLTSRELIVAGALQNRALWILASAFGFLQFGVRGDAVEDLLRSGEELSLSPASWVGLTLALFLVGWAVSIISTVIKYGGFRIDRYEKGLRMHYGLLAQTEVLLPLKRVQALTVIRPLLYRWFGYAEVRADALGSFDEKVVTGGVTLSPIVHGTRVNRLVGFVFPGRTTTGIAWRPISRKSIRRGVIARCLVWGVLIAVAWAATRSMRESGILEVPAASWAGLVLAMLLWAVLVSVAQFKRAGWQIDDEFLMIRAGVLRQTVELVPRSTIQWSEQSGNWFMRRMRIANITVATAVRRHQVPELDLPEAEGLLATLSHSGTAPGAIISS